MARAMQVVADGTQWMIRLAEGDDLHTRLGEAAAAHRIHAGAVVLGIGQLKSGSVGFWNGREYAPKEFRSPMELLALGGSIAVADGRPSIHLHATLSGPDHSVIGGHLVLGTVGLLAEILVAGFPNRTFGRPMVESLGLRVLDLEPPPNP
ncbi:MAG TPA: PPC domain-containing DNA-binding protein [Thermoplasmata archaeon]|nr:PPC domain-containing DNA-binding protein [Thermoplasmata archaeon]